MWKLTLGYGYLDAHPPTNRCFNGHNLNNQVTNPVTTGGDLQFRASLAVDSIRPLISIHTHTYHIQNLVLIIAPCSPVSLKIEMVYHNLKDY
jgi:hypothetical protein